MGDLTYEPDYHFDELKAARDLDVIAEECGRILNMETSDKLDELFLLGGSSGGARPKIFTKLGNF